MIPDAAVEAVAKVLCEQLWDNAHESQRAYARDEAREALEAAAPHMTTPRTEGREYIEEQVKSIVQEVAMTVDYTDRLYAAVQEIMDITMPRAAK